MDEMFELLTLAQTEKLAKRICVVIYGKEYWDRIINFRRWWISGVHLAERLRAVPLGQYSPGSHTNV